MLLKKKRYEELVYTQKDFRAHSIAFVTLDTDFDTLKVETGRNDDTRSFIKTVCNIFYKVLQRKRPKGYKILKAPEPEDIKWKFIGFSR